MFYLETNELYHHGVKGQKWGVIRKRLRSVSRAASAGGRTTARAAIRGKKYVERIIAKKKSIKSEVKNTKRKDPSKMTDDELRSANARLKLENKYIEEYNKRYPKRTSKAQKFVEDSLQKLGNTAVSSMQDYMKNVAKNTGNPSNQNKSENKKKDKNKKSSTKTQDLNARIVKLNGGSS